MQNVAKFSKVSFKQFCADWENSFGACPDNIQEIYDNIKLPERATAGSAGYDFFTPCSITLAPKSELVLPTGIRVEIFSQAFLAIFPRSGLGFKFRLQLNNTVGIIDADYFNAENEGHILLKLFNDTSKNQTVEILASQGCAQGVFLPFGLTVDDCATATRTGGFGSTTK